MAEIGIGVLLWLILAVLGGVLICCHSAVYHLLRCYHTVGRGLEEFRQLAVEIQSTLLRVNAGLVQVHERYLILQRTAKFEAKCRAGLVLLPPPGHGVSSAVDGITRSLSPLGTLDLTPLQEANLREALRLVKEVDDAGVTWRNSYRPREGEDPDDEGYDDHRW